MAEQITLQNVEAILVPYLTTAATGATSVTSDIPDPTPAKYLRVLSFGGPARRDRVIDRPIVSLEAWGPKGKPMDAWAVMAKADAAMNALADGALATVAHGAAIGRPYRSDDPTTGRPRFVCNYQITIRATTT
jgi:hypothetical protein